MVQHRILRCYVSCDLDRLFIVSNTNSSRTNVTDGRHIGWTPAYNYGVKWGFTGDDLYSHDLSGQNAIVTGANSGIGYEISLALARLGADVTVACRNPIKCQQTVEKIGQDSRVKERNNEVSAMIVDTSSLSSVKEFSVRYLDEYDQLDMLFLNAGIFSSQKKNNNATAVPLSEDGIEDVFATNVIGHHLMYKLLSSALEKSKMARVVLTSSSASFQTFKYKVATNLETLNGVGASKFETTTLNYGQSKLAQIMLAKHLTRKLGPSSTVYVNAAHPGVVSTSLFNKSPKIPDVIMPVLNYLKSQIMWTTEEGALTPLYLGVAIQQLQDKNIRGKFYHPQSVEMINPLSLDEELQSKVWKFCDELVEETFREATHAKDEN